MTLHHPDLAPFLRFTTRARIDKTEQTLEGMADRILLPAPRSSLSLRPKHYRLRNVTLRGLTPGMLSSVLRSERAVEVNIAIMRTGLPQGGAMHDRPRRMKGQRNEQNASHPYPMRIGGTVLIEWERPEECDSHSTISWIVSKSGTILRHRHQPPHEC